MKKIMNFLDDFPFTLIVLWIIWIEHQLYSKLDHIISLLQKLTQ